MFRLIVIATCYHGYYSLVYVKQSVPALILQDSHHKILHVLFSKEAAHNKTVFQCYSVYLQAMTVITLPPNLEKYLYKFENAGDILLSAFSKTSIQKK